MADHEPIMVQSDSDQVPAILELVRAGFAYMEERIDPPSSMHRLDEAAIRKQCANGEVWTIGDPPHACIFLTDKPGRLYVGKLAVAEDRQGRGCARALIDKAAERAAAKGFCLLELETRVELHENHAVFRRLGFEKTGEGAHAGYDRPTFIVMQKHL